MEREEKYMTSHTDNGYEERDRDSSSIGVRSGQGHMNKREKSSGRDGRSQAEELRLRKRRLGEVILSSL